ncbi:hypothetical protein MKW94_022801 [Papaver nudicaule]|uniref:Uncharacterized protein n=1 Tax=Papaver nudicaule TaxID=74823 RepID=A0AA41VL50_PAPNU|nr:hypothetical protein [Papaver nudicaule]
MGTRKKIKNVDGLVPFTVVVITLLQCIANVEVVAGAPMIPAMFVFGDSLVDHGNNNYLSSIAKANYLPYGIDFNGWPTGRFSNGRTIIDILADKLGIPYVPSFADPTTRGSRLLNGVNYASAAAGILDETGQHYGQRFSLSTQVLNFESTLDQLRSQMGSGRNLTQYLAKSIAVMVFGSNDYISNFLMPSIYPSSINYSPEDFANLLLNHYTRQILALYSVGLRKFLLAGIGPLGCIPNQRASGQAPKGQCFQHANQILGTFNVGLRTLVGQLNANHPGSIFVYANTYGAMGDILNNPAMYGFNTIDHGCCGVEGSERITCLLGSMPCPNRNQYVFWDAFHPTQAVNAILAERLWMGPPGDCYPINMQQMALI